VFTRGAQSGDAERALTGPLARRYWPKLRAAIISYFLFFSVLAAVPATGGSSAERFERPVVRAELERWARLFESVGFDVDPARLQAGYLRFAGAVEHLREFALWPIAWWFELTQTGQGWRLFGTPQERPNALVVSVHSGGVERVLYQSGDPERRWHEDLFGYRRVRAAYNPQRGSAPPTYEGFVARVGELAFRELSDAERVSVSLIESHTTLPGQAADPARVQSHLHELQRPQP
jgi:hypothetical protein